MIVGPATIHPKRLEVGVADKFTLLAFRSIFCAHLDDFADDLGVEARALGFRHNIRDGGLDFLLLDIEVFDTLNDRKQTIRGDGVVADVAHGS